MNFGSGFVQIRRGILEHTWDGRLSFNDFGIEHGMLLLSDKATALWHGSAPALNTILHVPTRTAQYSLERLEDGEYILRDFTPGARGNYPILLNKYLLTVGQFKGWRVNLALTKRYYGIPSGHIDVQMRHRLKEVISKACRNPVLEPWTEDAEELVQKLRERGVEPALVLLQGGVVSIPQHPNTSDTSKPETCIPSNEWMDGRASATDDADARCDLKEIGTGRIGSIPVTPEGSGVSVQPGSEAPDATPGSVAPLHDEWCSLLGVSIADLFSQLLGKHVPETETEALLTLLQQSGLAVPDFAEFLEFAAVTNEFSADYLRKAADPVASLEKNLDKLLARFDGAKAASKARIEAAVNRKVEYKGTRVLSGVRKKLILARFQSICGEQVNEADFDYLRDPFAFEVVQWFTEVNDEGRVTELIDKYQPETVRFENFDDFASFYSYVRSGYIRHAKSPVKLPVYDGLPTCPECKSVKQRSGHVCDPEALKLAQQPKRVGRGAFLVEEDEL